MPGDGGFSYNEYLGIPYGIVAWGLTAVFGLALATLQISWVRRQIQARLPEGVDRDMMENGKWWGIMRVLLRRPEGLRGINFDCLGSACPCQSASSVTTKLCSRGAATFL